MDTGPPGSRVSATSKGDTSSSPDLYGCSDEGCQFGPTECRMVSREHFSRHGGSVTAGFGGYQS